MKHGPLFFLEPYVNRLNPSMETMLDLMRDIDFNARSSPFVIDKVRQRFKAATARYSQADVSVSLLFSV